MEIQRCGAVLAFQSTLPYRERRKPQVLLNPHSQFQSTLPYRERPNTLFNDNQVSGFQSTLPYRERHFSKMMCRRFYKFQSTLPYRERPQSRTNHLTIFRDYCTIITICSCQHKPYDTNHTYFLSFSCTNAVRISQRLYERLWFALLLSHLII